MHDTISKLNIINIIKTFCTLPLVLFSRFSSLSSTIDVSLCFAVKKLSEKLFQINKRLKNEVCTYHFENDYHWYSLMSYEKCCWLNVNDQSNDIVVNIVISKTH